MVSAMACRKAARTFGSSTLRLSPASRAATRSTLPSTAGTGWPKGRNIVYRGSDLTLTADLVIPENIRLRIEADTLTVPEGSVFLMGDNRNHSSDSRDSNLGTVDTRLLIGKAVFLLFPGPDYLTEQRDFSRIGLLN